MVDVDRRITALNPAHIAGLKRLSARASQIPSSTRNGLVSFTSLSTKLISHLQTTPSTSLQLGLSEPEFSRIEAQFAFTFPPDLRAILSSALPVGPGFPEWRSTSHLRAAFDLPIASISLQIARNFLWSKSWGLRPSDPEKAIRVARIALKKAPILIPIFNHCYIPSNPCLAGNPVFFIDQNQIFCCGFDLSDFFDRVGLIRSLESDPVSLKSVSEKMSVGYSRRSLDARRPRWVEFWSDAAESRRRKSLSSSTERFIEMRRFRVPVWVEEYVEKMGSVLRGGGWSEVEVSEIAHVSGCDWLDDEEEGEIVLVDNQAVLDGLLVKADRFSDLLRKAGWSSEEVSDVLGLDFRPTKPVKKLSPQLVQKIGKLAQSISRS